MKRIFFMLGLVASTGIANAQEPIIVEGKPLDGDAKKSQEIIIRQKGDKANKFTVEINGDKILINGKPLSEFKDADISINKRNIIIKDGKDQFSFNPGDMEVFFNDKMNNFSSEQRVAFLGVKTGIKEDGQPQAPINGAYINEVTKESAADKAGLKEGDIITKVNDKVVASPNDLTDIIPAFKPKEEVTVYYTRDGKEKLTKVVLGERVNNNAMAYSFKAPNGMQRGLLVPGQPLAPLQPNLAMPRIENWDKDLEAPQAFVWNGDNNIELAFNQKPKIGLKIQDLEEGSGVKVLDTDKDSPAEKAGLKKDDIITEINGKKVSNTDEAREQLSNEEGKNKYTIQAKRGTKDINFEIKIPKKLKTANL